MTESHFIAGWFAGFFSLGALWLGAFLAVVYYKTIGKE